MSWVRPDPDNPIVQFLDRVSDIVCNPIRRLFPTALSGIDFAPFIAMLLIWFVRMFLVGTLRASTTSRAWPRSTRGVAGWMPDGTLRLRVNEPAREGRANDAVCELLSEMLGVPASDVSVVHGAGSRTKLIEVRGLDAPVLRARLEKSPDPAAKSPGHKQRPKKRGAT